jgi:hypothetical protein
MPCDTTLQAGQTAIQRKDEIKTALKRLEGYLSEGKVTIQIGQNGAVAFVGWNDRNSVTDVCAYRALAAQHSWALRQAVQRAEATQGRKVNAQAVAAGWHSHDGGQTWGHH